MILSLFFSDSGCSPPPSTSSSRQRRNQRGNTQPQHRSFTRTLPLQKEYFQRTFVHLGLRSPFFPSSGCRHPPPAVKHRFSLFYSPPLTAGEGQKFLGCPKRRESLSAIWPRKGLLVDLFVSFCTDLVCFILNKSV
ncbi:hypothetical protein SLE2022_404440 [Rubroshorea leprosula]